MSIVGSGGGCFPAGVLIMTPHGETEIESLKAGDEVLSFGFDGKVSVSKVTLVHRHNEDKIQRMNYWGGSIRVTANHWMLNQYNSFALAGSLTDHDALVDSIGHLRPVISTSFDGVEPVYNLTVFPNHTFIADGIRVHNGGRGLTRPVVGSGGGGSKGGGGSHIATEDPDSLQSHQYAKVIDLISEGPIAGLVNGLQSIYLDETPVMSSDGTLNFTGVTMQYRNGTNDQDVIEGFSEVENESSVNVEIKHGAPVVRSVSGELDAVRVTLSVPALTQQDMTNGDLHGSSVQVSLAVNNNGGGFKDVPLRWEWTSEGSEIVAGNQVNVADGSGARISLDLTFPTKALRGRTKRSPVTWRIEYKPPGAVDWIFLTRESAPYDRKPTISRTYYTPYGEQGAWSIRAVLESGGMMAVTGGGSLQLSGTDDITGKTTSLYKRSYHIPLPAPGPWDIKVTRNTPDSTSSALQNQTWWNSIAEIVESKLSYPNSALVGSSIDAEQFSNIPTRGYEIYGIICQVPVNYDPIARTYSGLWDGTFRMDWTNNPVWVYYDILTSNRYGLGELINTTGLDKWSLYDVAQYCDEYVPSGFVDVVSGLEEMEHRFTCNLYIQTREDAYKILTNMTSIFRGMAYWSAGQVTVTCDMPSDPVAIFTNANVIDGTFTYSGSSRAARHTVALVTWNDPDDMYRQKVEYVDDVEGIKRYGINQTEVVAFGCTSKGQAHRFGKWILYTERLESEVVSWKTGLEGTAVYPGAVVQVADSLRSGDRIGGRILEATSDTITLDSVVTLESGVSYTLSVVLPEGSTVTHPDGSTSVSKGGDVVDCVVTNSAGETDVLTIATPLATPPQKFAMWILASVNLVPQTFRVISVVESGKTQVEITALQHNPHKYQMVEYNMVFDESPISSIGLVPKAPTDLTGTLEGYAVPPNSTRTRISVSWSSKCSVFRIRYREFVDGIAQNWKKAQITGTPHFEVDDVPNLNYEVAVTAIDALGHKSQEVSAFIDALDLNAFTTIGLPPPQSVQLFCSPDANGHVTKARVRYGFQQKDDAYLTTQDLAFMISVNPYDPSFSVVADLGTKFQVADWDILASGTDIKILAGSSKSRIVIADAEEPLPEGASFSGMFWAQFGTSEWRKCTSYDETGINFAEEFDVSPVTGDIMNWVEISLADERQAEFKVVCLTDGKKIEVVRWTKLDQVGETFFLDGLTREQERSSRLNATGLRCAYYPAPGAGTQAFLVPASSIVDLGDGNYEAAIDLDINVPMGSWIAATAATYRSTTTGLVRSPIVPVTYGGAL